MEVSLRQEGLFQVYQDLRGQQLVQSSLRHGKTIVSNKTLQFPERLRLLL